MTRSLPSRMRPVMGSLAFLTEASTASVMAFSKRAQESLVHLEERLLNQKVVLTDATVVSVNGKQNYIQNFSVGNTIVYHAMKEQYSR